jgi:hypothetical protein
MSLVRVRKNDIGLRALAGIPMDTVGAALPSGDAALKLVRGQPGGLVAVGTTMLVRGALAAVGLAVAGFRGAALFTGAAAAVLAIEAGVLVWAYGHRDQP